MQLRTLALAPIILGTLCCTSGQPSLPSPTLATSCAGVISADTTVYDLSQVTEKPGRRSGPPPWYPPSAYSKGIQGTVLIDVVIEPTGMANPKSIKVISGPDPALDQAAEQTVRDARYWPACRGSTAVRVHIHIPIQFSLAPQRGAA
jgi:protein TonB